MSQDLEAGDQLSIPMTEIQPSSESPNTDEMEDHTEVQSMSPNEAEAHEDTHSQPCARVKLTGYRFLNIAALIGFGIAKFILSLYNKPIAGAGIDWVGAGIGAAM
jgi:hypothetical protein